jgi:hypothetical protein
MIFLAHNAFPAQTFMHIIVITWVTKKRVQIVGYRELPKPAARLRRSKVRPVRR